MAVYQVAKLLCTRAGQQCQISDRGFFGKKSRGPIDCSAITLAPLSIFIVLLFVHTAAVFAALLNLSLIHICILLNAILPGNDYEFDSNPGTGEGTSLRV